MVDRSPVSIIINTDGRAASLSITLKSLGYLRYPRFEVVVIAGPTPDGTHSLLETWQNGIKIGHCPTRNLSQSRNIGLAISSGEIVAFIDDDAVPEPEWLDDVIPSFSDPGVGAAGGFVHKHTGKGYQFRFETTNRFGTATSRQRATPEFNFPYSFDIPSLLGTNSFFRRNAIIDVGGFDEEFEYYLDETDIICRIVDCGWRVAQLDRGFVHHKYLPSSLRNEHRVITSWYPSIKSKAYFAVVNGCSHSSMQRIFTEVSNYVDWARGDIRRAIENRLVAPEVARQFERDADQAMRDGLMRGMRGKRRVVSAASLMGDPARFLLFPRLSAAVERQQCFVFLSSNYPPEPLGGIGRYVHLLARLIAGHGHQVHLLTKGQGHDRIDFEDGVWVHRCVVREFAQPRPGPGTDQPIPPHIWNYSMTMLAEAKEIASRRPLHCVHAPIWDVEAIAFLRDGGFPLITSLHTTLAMHLDSGSDRQHDANFTTAFIEPVLAAEKELLTRSDGVLANSEAIIREIEQAYGLRFAPERLRVVRRGLEDWTLLPGELPDPIGSEMVRVAFVGRLEPRKGIDVLMRIVPDLLDRYAKLWLDIVGYDLIAGPSGRTWREVFEAHLGGHPGRDRVAFHGAVSEERLRGFYRTSDIVLAPSRFESFGLVHLEAMMFGRAVVGCRIGGMPEVITDGRTGLLAQPGDETSLRDCLDRLLENPELRQRLGKAGRGEYLARFGAERMAAEEENFLLAVASRSDRRNAQPSLAPTAIRNPVPSSERTGGPPRIAIIGGIVARYDAISDDIVNTWRYLREQTGWHVSILATGSDYEGVPVRIVGGVAELLMAAEFLSADVLLYHFGIWNPVFDALPVGNGRARQAVFFHNITPPELVPPKARSDIERSFAQLHNLRFADCLWPVSRVNYEMLQELHFEPDRIDILPGAVPGPALTGLADKLPVPIEVLCLGRIVPSKGVRDLVAAVALIHKRSLPPFCVKIAGNLTFSDKDYCDLVREDIIGQGLADTIEFVGTVTPAKRDRLLHTAHIVAFPSYHEGFCKSAIEGLRAGCVPVGYAAYNLRYIADGLCRMVMPGDIAGLANALADTISGIAAVLIDPAAQLQLDRGMSTAAEFAVAAREHVNQFSPEIIGAATRLRVGQLLRMRVPFKYSSSPSSKMHRIVRRFTANDARLLTQIGRREKNRICVDGSSAGTALYGPYVPMAPGNYEATIRFDPAVTPTGFATMDVCADVGREVLAVQTITAEQVCDQGFSASLVFSGAHPIPDVEVRLSCSTGFVAAIQSVEICGELIRSSSVDDFKLTDLPEIRVQNRIYRGRNSYEGYQRGIGLSLPEVVTKIKMDPDFQQARELSGDRTIVSENNLFNIFMLIKLFIPQLPTAHVVEFGSFRGGSAIFMSFLARKFLPKAQVLSFDTFAGMPATDSSIDFHNAGDFHEVDLEELQQYIKQIGLTNLKFVQGNFEETAPFTLKEIRRVSLCHIDCDIRSAIHSAYDATKPYMVPGGYWVFDDPLLATCLGATEAVEDLLVRRDALNAEQVSPHLVFREPFEKA
jgi:glycosyltransferase involved in cell wall biosynthesis/GT2 family glycosyltransferase